MQDNLKHCAYRRSSAVSRHTDKLHPASRGALPNRVAPPFRTGRQTRAVLPSWTKLSPPSRVGPNSRRSPKLDQTHAVLPSWTKLAPPSRVGPDSRRPPKSTRAVCGRLDPNGRPSRTGLRQTFRAGPCRTFSGRPAGRPAFVPVKATPTKPPVRFPRGL